jgi:hypothetical protein
MRPSQLLAIALAFAACSVTPADARTRVGRAGPQQQQVQLPPAPPVEKCLRALNGDCTNPVVVEAARLRAIIIPSVRVSYFGTPAGTIGGAYIPFERFFQDDPIVFGLPTAVLVQPCCVTRSK